MSCQSAPGHSNIHRADVFSCIAAIASYASIPLRVGPCLPSA
ncbi:unnamed protein product, partial [Staurois parvus]